MLNAQNTTQAQTVKPAAIIYAVELAGKPAAEVRATKRGLLVDYLCTCSAFALWGGCEHVQAVEAERKAQGRAH